MTKEEKQKLNQLRLAGMKAKEISEELGIPFTNVRTYISRHPQIEGLEYCKMCDRPITQTSERHRHSFCSDACKVAWFNSERGHTRGPIKQCKHCGKEYRSYGNKSFCSRGCYLSAIQQG